MSLSRDPFRFSWQYGGNTLRTARQYPKNSKNTPGGQPVKNKKQYINTYTCNCKKRNSFKKSGPNGRLKIEKSNGIIMLVLRGQLNEHLVDKR